MPPNLVKLRNLMNKLKPNWPKIHKYIGGGVNGRVFELNDGRYMKMISNNAPQEWKTLLRLQGSHVVPRFNKKNHLAIRLQPKHKEEVKNMLGMEKIGNKLTIMIMGRVGGGQAMTLRQYYKKFRPKKMNSIQERVHELIDEMHLRGVSHGNLHSGNILVSANTSGHITGMWVIDFGMSYIFPLGKTERNFYGRFTPGFYEPTPTLSGITGCEVPVYSRSRANVNMAKVHYCKNYPEIRANKIKKHRLNIAENLKLLKSPRKVSSVRRTKSASPSRRRT